MPRQVTTIDDALEVYAAKSLSSPAVARLDKGVAIELGGTTEHEGREWMEVILEDGRAGYVLGPSARGHTTLAGTRSPVEAALEEIVAAERSTPAETVNDGSRDIAVGGAFFALGAVITVTTYLLASKNGGTYYIGWGPILFGGFRLVRGLVRRRS